MVKPSKLISPRFCIIDLTYRFEQITFDGEDLTWSTGIELGLLKMVRLRLASLSAG